MKYRMISLNHILHFSKIILSSMLTFSILLFAFEANNHTSAADSKQSSLSGQSATGCLAKVRKDGKWGYMNPHGKVIIPFQYDFAWKFSNGLAMVRKNRKNGYINKKGEVIIPFKVEHVSSFHNELAKVRNNNKYGFMDITGKIVIPCQFDQAADFSEELARVYDSSSQRYGFIDKTGKLVIPYQYIYVVADFSEQGIFKEGFAAEKKGGPGASMMGYIDKMGNEAISFSFFETRGFSEGLAAVMKSNGEWLYIDKTGKTIIQLPRGHSPFVTGGFKEGLARVFTPRGLRYIDKSGNEITTPPFSYGEDFSEGLAAVEKGLWGYIDKTGKAVIPFQFEKAGSFTNGLARVQANDGKWGYIDKTGQVVIPYQFEYAWEFNIAD